MEPARGMRPTPAAEAIYVNVIRTHSQIVIVTNTDTPSQARRLASLFVEADDSALDQGGLRRSCRLERKLHLSKSPLSSRKDTQSLGTSVHLPFKVFNCTVFTANALEPIILFFCRTVRWVNAPGMKVELRNAPLIHKTVRKICIKLHIGI